MSEQSDSRLEAVVAAVRQALKWRLRTGEPDPVAIAQAAIDAYESVPPVQEAEGER